VAVETHCPEAVEAYLLSEMLSLEPFGLETNQHGVRGEPFGSLLFL